MLVLSLFGCVVGNSELPVTPSETFSLETLDAGVGDGRSVAEYVRDELSLDLTIDWSFLNLAGFSPDDIALSPGEVPSEVACPVDANGDPTECSFNMDVSVASTSGLWDAGTRSNLVSWQPGALHFCFGGDVALDSGEASSVSSALADDDIAFSGVLNAYVCRHKDGSGYGLPDASSDADVLLVEAGDDNTGVEAFIAADDTIDASRSQ